MELKDKCTAASDDEDDIEKLRLAALQSLKRNVPEETRNISKNLNKPAHIHHKKRNFQGRGGRNGQFYNRHKNTNLISIPTVANDGDCSEITHFKTKFNDGTAPKLTLPQDRYCNVKSNDNKPTETSSKFDRYDNSDKSESESECYDDSNSESESPAKLEKASSLEALMQELENEIQGDTKSKEEKVIKPNKIKKPKQKISVSETPKENLSESPIENEKEVKETQIKTECEPDNVETTEEKKETKCDTKKCLSKITLSTDCKKALAPRRLHKKYYSDRNTHNSSSFIPRQSYVAQSVMYPADIHFPQPLGFNSIMPYNTSLSIHQPILPINPSSGYVHPITTGSSFDRPTSPLSLNTDDALTITRAPLSPRSAAFVLQNREIIERRKKSPRRSYSRSPSPRYRRSISPTIYTRSNRSASPRKFIKSKSRSPIPLETSRRLSPGIEKIDPVRERRLSPLLDRSPLQRKTSPLRDRRSPLRSKTSPHRQKYVEKRSPNARRTPIERSPKANYRNSPKGSVRERLGTRSNKQSVNTDTNSLHRGLKRSRSKSLSPEINETKEKNEKDELDPILEARRKKFETNEIKNTEGIIRLKPKTENNSESENFNDIVPNNEEIVQEDELVDLLDTKVDDIFSDEETDEENEGRFKSNLNKSQRNVSVLPFTQLLDNSTKNIKTEILKGTKAYDRHCAIDRNRKRQRSRSPLKNKDTRNYSDRSKISDSKNERSIRKSSTKDKLYSRNKILFKNGSSSRREKPPVTAPIENKKIEIKIRNPSKYETTSKYDVANEHETLERLEKNIRNVEVSDIKKESDEENSDSEIANDIEGDVEDNVDISSNQKCEAGDLRAQLSRKRAERQNKLPIPEDVQSRLLQNALQGAVFKKPKKSRKEKEPAPKDGKLPIHFRLGYSSGVDIFQDKVSTKRKRGKSKGRIDQV